MTDNSLEHPPATHLIRATQLPTATTSMDQNPIQTYQSAPPQEVPDDLKKQSGQQPTTAGASTSETPDLANQGPERISDIINNQLGDLDNYLKRKMEQYADGEEDEDELEVDPVNSN